MTPPSEAALKSARADVYRRLVGVLRDMPSVGKEASNKGLQYSFRSIEAILAHLNPLLGAAGLALAPEVVEHTYERAEKGWVATVLVRYRVLSEDGSEVVLGPSAGAGHDQSDKAMSKAMTYAFKSFLHQLLAIADHDPDYDAPDVGGGRAREESWHDSAPAPDWEHGWWVDNGWESKEQHDEWHTSRGNVLRGADEATQVKFKAWRIGQKIGGFNGPHSRAQADAIDGWLEYEGLLEPVMEEPDASPA